MGVRVVVPLRPAQRSPLRLGPGPSTPPWGYAIPFIIVGVKGGTYNAMCSVPHFVGGPFIPHYRGVGGGADRCTAPPLGVGTLSPSLSLGERLGTDNTRCSVQVVRVGTLSPSLS